MDDATRLAKPAACTAAELSAFARLVRQGFAGSDDGLADRIAAAERLALHYAGDRTLAAIAALKAPAGAYRRAVFESANAAAAADAYRLELGWVFVLPAHRGARLGERLCRRLLATSPTTTLFATTRPDNGAMIRILVDLGFARTGRPFRHPRRDEELALFLRRRRAPDGDPG